MISLLISSDFLQMHDLVSVCIKYFSENMGAVLKYPVDLTCLNASLIDKLHTCFTVEVKKTKKKKSKSCFWEEEGAEFFTHPNILAFFLMGFVHMKKNNNKKKELDDIDDPHDKVLSFFFWKLRSNFLFYL